jgi:prepilin-type N-terminal cleavage/methylation domain-containing protein
VSRRGATLVELLVVIVILGIIGGSVTNLLISQTRLFAREAGGRDARAVSRNALNIVRDEMRMIEPRGIVTATDTALTVRVPYAMGVYCASNTATFVPVDSLIYAQAAYAGYAYRDTALNAAYTYVAKTAAPTTGTASTCSSGPGITPIPNGKLLVLSPAFPSLPSGAPVLLYQTVTYALGPSTLVPGRTALWRRVAGGVSEEIAVPFQNTAIFRFYLSGAKTSQASPPAAGSLHTISGIELVLTGESEKTVAGRSAPERSSVRLSIFFRNAVI